MQRREDRSRRDNRRGSNRRSGPAVQRPPRGECEIEMRAPSPKAPARLLAGKRMELMLGTGEGLGAEENPAGRRAAARPEIGGEIADVTPFADHHPGEPSSICWTLNPKTLACTEGVKSYLPVCSRLVVERLIPRPPVAGVEPSILRSARKAVPEEDRWVTDRDSKT